jgi:hypothetical protein
MFQHFASCHQWESGKTQHISCLWGVGPLHTHLEQKMMQNVLFWYSPNKLCYCSSWTNFQTANNNSLQSAGFHSTCLVHTGVILYIGTSTNICLLCYSRPRNIHNTLSRPELQSSACFMRRVRSHWLLMEMHARFMSPEFLIDCVGALWISAAVLRYLENIRTQSSVEYILNELIFEHVYIYIHTLTCQASNPQGRKGEFLQAHWDLDESTTKSDLLSM